MLKRIAESFILATVVMFAMNATCQNGPTQPSVVLTWTQSSTPGVTKNCIYRGSASGSYTIPALACIAAGTTYTDASPVPNTTYWYAVTAQVGTTESAYSVPVQVPIPANPSAPTNLSPASVAKNEDKSKPSDIVARVEWK